MITTRGFHGFQRSTGPSLLTLFLSAHSDVLLRHAKYFHGQGESGTHQRHEDRAAKDLTRPGRIAQSSADDGGDSNIDVDVDVDCEDLNDDEAPTRESAVPAHSLAMDEPPPAADQLVTSDLDTIAAASMLQAQNDGLNPHANAVLQPSIIHPRHIQQDALPSGAGTGDMSHNMSSLVGETSPIYGMDVGTPPQLPRVLGDSCRHDCEFYPGLADMDPVCGINFGSHEIKDNTDISTDNISAEHLQNTDYLDFMSFGAEMNFPSTRLGSNMSRSDRANSIPAERLAQVARLWPNSNSRCMTDDEATRLWAEVVAYKGDNILTDLSVAETSPAPSIGRESGSSWGLDEDRRQDLIRELAQDHSARECDGRGFPPTRLLNLGLDVLFRQSSSLLQCIHRPTFSAKSAPPLVVLSSCLLGLVLLDSTHVRALAVHFLPVSLIIRMCPVFQMS